MKCAKEMANAVQLKLINESMEREKRKAECIKEAIEHHYEHLSETNAYVEQKLLEGNGTAEILVAKDSLYCSGVGFFDGGFGAIFEKEYRNGYLWWDYQKLHIIHLNTYVKMLTDLCYNVEISDATYVGYSCTGKSNRKVQCVKLKISI
jgi:hypothetical protein